MLKKVARKISAYYRPLFVENLVGKQDEYPNRALLYYKTGWFLKNINKLEYRHTNEWEITEIVRILNSLGFVVDVVDRGAADFNPTDKYHLFIGLAAGDSGKYYKKYADKLPSAIKVALCEGPEPTLAAKLVREHYAKFNLRNKSSLPTMREPTIDFDSFAKSSDALLVIGEEGQFCYESYKRHNLPKYNFLPGCSSEIRFLYQWIATRDRTKFICFAGDGFICKGVDLVVEAFSRHPELSVHICGPDSEQGFFDVLGETIKNSKNIFYEGFVGVGSKKFENLARSCSFSIFNPAAEGVTTSVASVMIAGIVPVVNYETGINVDTIKLGIKGNSERVKSTEDAIIMASSLSDSDYKDAVIKTIVESQKYTQQSFSTSFKSSVSKIMQDFLTN
ncbi:glycosyltransferase [Candidatus Pseudothioglobus singularis]|nr:glycosyltransferase [Candidatus Pseudothioglobus singularis]